MKLFKAFLIRLTITVIPLLGLYVYAEIAFKANREKEHPTDVGLGIAILLAFVAVVLFVGFLADLILRLIRKEYKIALIDIPFLIPFFIIIAYISCQMTSRECFCGWLIKLLQ